jgi:diadenosine tetraphosphate (Ap4A) HIT family hydrolase
MLSVAADNARMPPDFLRPAHPAPGCELCRESGGALVWQDDGWRVIRIADANFPGFYRVVSRQHVAEFSDLDAAARAHAMTLVATVERVLREALSPTKINLAALGNMVPHLHWHVIARFDWDSHFPNPIWGERRRAVEPPAERRLGLALNDLDAAVNAALAQQGLSALPR